MMISVTISWKFRNTGTKDVELNQATDRNCSPKLTWIYIHCWKALKNMNNVNHRPSSKSHLGLRYFTLFLNIQAQNSFDIWRGKPSIRQNFFIYRKSSHMNYIRYGKPQQPKTHWCKTVVILKHIFEHFVHRVFLFVSCRCF